MSAVGSPCFAHAVGDGVEAQVARLDVGDLAPLERRRHARVGHRAHRVLRGDGVVLGVLVVVDEHADALLLPPLRRRAAGHAALDLAGQGERGAADRAEVPLLLDADVDVDAARAAGLRVAAQAVLGRGRRWRTSATRRTSSQGTSGCGSRSMRSSSGWSRSERRTGCGFQSMLPRLIAHSRCAASFGHELGRAAPAGELDRRRLQPLGPPLGHALLEERSRPRCRP